MASPDGCCTITAVGLDIVCVLIRHHIQADQPAWQCRWPVMSRLGKQTATHKMYSAFMIGQMQALPVTTEALETVTRQDPLLSRVHEYVRDGWPSSTSEELKPFCNRQKKLTTQGQAVLWGNRAVIPSKLRPRIKEELHRTHPRISRMKALARSYL